MGLFDVSLLGDKDLERTLSELPDRMERKVLTRAFREAAVGTLRVAQANIRAPRVRLFPGQAGNARRERAQRRFALRHIARLRNHLHVVQLRRKKHRVGYRVVTGTRAEMGIRGLYYYPAHVELGHAAPGRGRRGAFVGMNRELRDREFGGRSTPPHPFLRPALKSREGAIIAGLTTSIRAGIVRENLRSGRP